MADQPLEGLERDRAHRPDPWRILSLTFVVLGVVLRGWQYYGDSAMWLDEIAIAQNVERQSIVQLLSTELDYAVAPAGFLVVQKVVTTILGTDDYAWRLWPFIASIAGLVLFARVASTSLNGIAASVSVGVLALATPLVWQGSQNKQYSSDVLATIVIVWMAQRLAWSTPPSSAMCGAAAVLGAAAIALSHSSVFVLAAVSIWLPLHAWRSGWLTQRRLIVSVSVVVGVWIAATLTGVTYASSMLSPELEPFLRTFWAHGFAPAEGSPGAQARWLAGRLIAFFGAGSPNVGGWSHLEYGSAGAAIAVALVVGGSVVLGFRRPWLASIVLTSTGLTLVASRLGRYPFDDRLILFLLPLFVLAIGAVVEAIASMRRQGAPYVAVVTAVIVLAIAARPYAAIGWPTYRLTPPVKPVLEFLQARRQPTDDLFILGVQSNVFGYYLERIDLAPAGFVVGACYNDPRGDRYLDQLTQFRGTPRLWVLFSGEHRSLRELLVTFLDAAGQRRDEFRVDQVPLTGPDVIRVEAMLYDLSDLARFDAARGAGVREGVKAGLAQEIGCPPMSLAPGRR